MIISNCNSVRNLQMDNLLFLEILCAFYFKDNSLRDSLLLVLIEKETCCEIFLLLETFDQELILCKLSHYFRVFGFALISGRNIERRHPYVDMSGAWFIILIVEKVPCKIYSFIFDSLFIGSWCCESIS